ncbi:hypothetical protein AcV7_002323 [Taiwanofungus camphoratus]|nr:hypothetical protein AcV7_002323 [Antrodia cinnamomea]
MSRPPSLDEIYYIAKKAVAIFAKHSLRCCLVGGAACALYGLDRCPNVSRESNLDLDLVVLTSDSRYPQEELKRLLVAANGSFYLVPSRNPYATYKVLWCRLPSARGFELERSCKVDILLPGVLNIPNVPAARLRSIKGHPVMPFLPLLLLKLQAWTDHQIARRLDLQRKQHVDVRDIDALLIIAARRGTRVENYHSWLGLLFLDAGQRRVHQYITRFPNSAPRWKDIGFQTHRSVKTTSLPSLYLTSGGAAALGRERQTPVALSRLRSYRV